jgi:RNA polymerase sigma factor (sigma-70 family)
MEVLDKIEDKLGIWEKKRTRKAQAAPAAEAKQEAAAPTPAAQEREQRIIDNLHLVGPIAGKLARTNRHIDIDDLTSVGNEALIEAVDKFDPKKGETFEHYARTAIRNRMLTYVGKESRQPKQMTEDTPEPVARAEASTLERGEVVNRVREAVGKLPVDKQRLIMSRFRSGHKATLQQLADEAGVSPQAIAGKEKQIMLILRRNIDQDLAMQSLPASGATGSADLAGMPVIKLPPGASGSEDSATTDIGKAAKMGRNLRNDEQASIILPDGWDITTLQTGGKAFTQIADAIKRLETRMLMSALAQFLLLGQDSVGSFALSKDQSDFFLLSVNAVADNIARTFTKYAIPQLLKLHGKTAEGIKLNHTSAGSEDVSALGVFLQQVGSMISWTPQDEAWLRRVARMPEISVEELEAAQEEKQARAKEMQDAIKKRMAEKSQEENPEQPDTEDETEDNPDQPEEDDMRADYFASRPQDAERAKLERKMQRALATYMEKARKRVMSAARQMREKPFIS